MPRALESLNQGGYVEPIDVTDADLDRVVALLNLTDQAARDRAREQIYGRLEDFKTARVRTAKAKPISDDRLDLEAVSTAMEPMRAIDQPDLALDALESLRSKNFVLYRRLQWQLGPRRIPDLIRAVDQGTESIEAVAREVVTAIAALKEVIAKEDGRGAPTDYPARSFASNLHRIWKEFTGRGTSRQNRLGQERDPFGDFVDAAGKLIEPDFNGRFVARQIHEASQDETKRGRRRS
ncbi:MAG: hypothetical protein SFX72_01705 [Isosphaeraceae bacterium]|nr:hypothetical protein [Isosphaeraceae bacterium]